MDNDERVIDYVQFMKELFRSYLEVKNSNGVVRPTSMEFSNWNSIVSAISSIINPDEKKESLEKIVLYLRKKGNCYKYTFLLGKNIFEANAFSWDLFRAFLAFLCELASIASEKKIAFVYEDLISSSAWFIQKQLLHRIQSLDGYKRFEKDCIRKAVEYAKEIKNNPKETEVEVIQVDLPQRGHIYLFSYEGRMFCRWCYNSKERHIQLDLFSEDEDDASSSNYSSTSSHGGVISALQKCTLAHYVSVIGIGVTRILHKHINQEKDGGVSESVSETVETLKNFS